MPELAEGLMRCPPGTPGEHKRCDPGAMLPEKDAFRWKCAQVFEHLSVNGTSKSVHKGSCYAT